MVSLNPIMVDGTGMCGGCRVIVGGRPQFACVDGPEFDAHQVDFRILMQRNAMYRDMEKASLDRFEADRVAAKKAVESDIPVGKADCESGGECRFVQRVPELAGVWKGGVHPE